ncbi:IclR family transcriptional regulator [Natronomonas salsuginis]|jgi:DNA-binding IclR family transcriptional regulator|uniref:IclR family transcriptional regulator n=1 Tax=Natronomonas salsuginis TaxID=2217661 RepID=A0A4U5JDR2_9EURY|nr:IclR family transcriptional regulator [Natronomonas salsuginis]TKR25998.1 IclR family transcriptional regulator [Natronomonas salsuginis]
MPDTQNRSVTRSFRIVDALSKRNGTGVSELSSAVDLPVSTVHDHLQALRSTGHVVKEGTEYRISTRFLELGHRDRRQREIYTAVADELSTAAEETGEQATLIVEEGGDGVLLAVAEGEQAVDLPAYPGARVPLYANAGGKAILAHVSPERLDELLDRQAFEPITKRTTTDRDVLLEQLDTARERGYAIDRGERIVGFVCVAVPVLDRGDTVRGSICVCGPESRMGAARREEILSTIRRVANITQVNMDYV